MIAAERLTVRYQRTVAVHAANLIAATGVTFGVIGPNGSGKSTMLRALFGAVRRQGGRVLIDDELIDELSATQRARRMAVVAQEEPSGLPLTVWDSVLLGRSPHLAGWQNYRDIDERCAADALARTGLTQLARKAITELSGGERQRVLIARALAQQSDHLLLDEPTNHLDMRYQHEILLLIQGLPLTTVVVLHDLNLAARYCDELLLMGKGRVVAHGTPAEVLTPEILQPVYGIETRRINIDGVPQLLFAPTAVP